MKARVLMVTSFMIACSALEFPIHNTGPVAAQQRSKLEPGLLLKAQKEGTVGVTVHLNLKAHSGERDVEKLKDELIEQLAGTMHKVRRRLETMSYMSLDVGPDALAVLERSQLVLTVKAIRIGSPA